MHNVVVNMMEKKKYIETIIDEIKTKNESKKYVYWKILVYMQSQ